jgi:hypothetical protein
MIDHEDWGVSNEFFSFIDDLWGAHSIDRFASIMNRKTERFNSLFWNPGSEAVDAFTQNWHGENTWLIPPIYLVVRNIKHLLFHKAQGTLYSIEMGFSHVLVFHFKGGLFYREYVTDVLEFKESSRIYIKGSNPKCVIYCVSCSFRR